jgi:hypothetical protein
VAGKIDAVGVVDDAIEDGVGVGGIVKASPRSFRSLVRFARSSAVSSGSITTPSTANGGRDIQELMPMSWD